MVLVMNARDMGREVSRSQWTSHGRRYTWVTIYECGTVRWCFRRVDGWRRFLPGQWEGGTEDEAFAAYYAAVQLTFGPLNASGSPGRPPNPTPSHRQGGET